MHCTHAASYTLCVSIAFAITLFTACQASSAIHDYRDGSVIPGTEHITPGPGVNMAGMTFSYGNLGGLDLTAGDLSTIKLTFPLFAGSNLTNANFTRASITDGDMTGVNFAGANLTSAVFTRTSFADSVFSDATVTGANFNRAVSRGFTFDQLSSTASYHAKNLHGINLEGNDLSGWNLQGQNLTSVTFSFANLANTNFTGATIHGTTPTTLGARISRASNFTFGQLASTASYQAKKLTNVTLEEVNLSGGDFSNFVGPVNFAGSNLFNVSLTNATFTHSVFEASNAQHANFANAKLDYSRFDRSDLSNASFVQASALSARFDRAKLVNADLTNVNFGQSHFFITDARGANFTGANLSMAIISAMNFTGANLTGANLADRNLLDSNFTDAIVAGATIGLTYDQLASTASFKAKDLRGIKLTGEFRAKDLSGQNFAGATLVRIGFTNSNLAGANFSGANLESGSLGWTDLRGATFGGANLRSTFLENADLSNADLTNAHFRIGQTRIAGANFSGARITGATMVSMTFAQLASTASFQDKDLSKIYLYGTDLSGQDLSGFNLTDTRLDGSPWMKNTNLSGAILNRTFFDEVDLSGCNFSGAVLTDVRFKFLSMANCNFSDAVVTRTNLVNFQNHNFSNTRFIDSSLSRAFTGGLTRETLMATANFRDGTFRRLDLTLNAFDGWDFSGFDFTDTKLGSSTFPNTTFSSADLRGATGFTPDATTVVTNTIHPGGQVLGLNLTNTATLLVRDHPLPIVVSTNATLDNTSTLSLVLEDAQWTSTISFAPGIPVTLDDATLRLAFAPNTNIPSLVGQSFHLFDWTGVTPAGAFEISSDYLWDTSALYTTGHVTLTAEAGDANVDAHITIADYLAIDRGFARGLNGWHNGDFDGSGAIDAADYFIIDSAYLSQISAAAVALPSAPVPEPMTLALAVPAALLALRRRKH